MTWRKNNWFLEAKGNDNVKTNDLGGVKNYMFMFPNGSRITSRFTLMQLDNVLCGNQNLK